MVLHVYCYRDKKLEAYDKPFYELNEPEKQSKLIARSCLLIRPEEKARAADQALYYFGTFDDETGKFDLKKEPAKLLDLESCIVMKA